MTRETFFEKFEMLADAPNAVAKMRELILQLAVQGKLTEQNANDEPASILIERIRKRTMDLVAQRKIKKQACPPIQEHEIPFSIPDTWQWTRLGDVGDWGSGSTPARDNLELYGGGIPWLKSGELNDNPRLSGSEETVTEKALLVGSFRKNQPGDVLLAMYGATLGKAAILAESAVTNQAICGCTPFEGVENGYLFRFLISQRSNFRSASEGGAQPNISKIKILNFLFPLPPLAEQKRIVAKVDELMALCDQLEAQQKARETKHTALARASLDRFAKSPTPENLELIFHKSFDVSPANLRKTILLLAVKGHLVPRIDSEGLGTDILLKKVSYNFEHFPMLPGHWAWAQLEQLATQMDSGWSPACLSEPSDPSEWGVLKTTAVQELEYRECENKKLPPDLQPRPEHQVCDGDILLTRAGPMNRVGIVCVARPTRGRLMISDKIIRFHLVAGVDPEYAALAMNAGHSRDIIEKLKSGMAASQVNISQPKLRSVPIPLPPTAEQRRIVAKVDALMALVDKLETQRTTSIISATSLLSSFVSDLSASHEVTC